MNQCKMANKKYWGQYCALKSAVAQGHWQPGAWTTLAYRSGTPPPPVVPWDHKEVTGERHHQGVGPEAVHSSMDLILLQGMQMPERAPADEAQLVNLDVGVEPHAFP